MRPEPFQNSGFQICRCRIIASFLQTLIGRERAEGLITSWRMPQDLKHAGIPGEKLQAERVPVAMKMRFDQLLHDGDTDQAWYARLDALEYTAERAALSRTGQRLPYVYKGKSKA